MTKMNCNKMETETLYKFRNEWNDICEAYKTTENKIVFWYSTGTENARVQPPKFENTIKQFNHRMNVQKFVQIN
jgi:hypothetical protein